MVTEIKIRNLDPSLIVKIDEQAKAKGMSRNAYLKNQIETSAVLYELKEQENRYINLVKLVTSVIEDNTKEIAYLRNIVEGDL